MKEIKPITTVERLYRTRGAATGECFVDAVVWLLVNRPDITESQQMGELLEVDASLLTKVIKLMTGTPLKEMITQWRMWQALQTMLEHPELDDEAISQQCGCGHAQDLEAKIKKRYHTTIGAFRHGQARRNGNYDYNQTAAGTREVQDNAQKLRDYITWLSTPPQAE